MVSDERIQELLKADASKMKVAELRSVLSEVGVEQPTTSTKKSAYSELFEEWQQTNRVPVGSKRKTTETAEIVAPEVLTPEDSPKKSSKNSAAKVSKKSAKSSAEEALPKPVFVETTTVVETTVVSDAGVTTSRQTRRATTPTRSVFADSTTIESTTPRRVRAVTPPRERRAVTPPRERAILAKVDNVLRSQAVELTPNTKFESYMSRKHSRAPTAVATFKTIPSDPLSVDSKEGDNFVADEGISDSEVASKSSGVAFLALSLVFLLWVLLFGYLATRFFHSNEAKFWEEVAKILAYVVPNTTDAPVTTTDTTADPAVASD